MHGNGDESGGVVTLEQRLLQFIHRHAEVVERLVGILLQLIAETPENDGGRVAVALDPLGHIVLPELFEGHLAAGVLTRPLVVELVDDEDAVLVAETDEVAAVGIVRGADMVHAELLHQQDALLDGLGVGGRTEGTEGVVVGIALEQHLAAVELQPELWTELDGADAELVAGLVGYGAVVTQQLDLRGI